MRKELPAQTFLSVLSGGSSSDAASTTFKNCADCQNQIISSFQRKNNWFIERCMRVLNSIVHTLRERTRRFRPFAIYRQATMRFKNKNKCSDMIGQFFKTKINTCSNLIGRLLLTVRL